MTYALAFLPAVWQDYQRWQPPDKPTLRRLNARPRELQRPPLTGTGKPELVRYARAGTWSRRITDEHRLVYGVEGDVGWLLQGRYHSTEK